MKYIKRFGKLNESIEGLVGSDSATNVKIYFIASDIIYFDNGYQLTYYHQDSCCETHWLDFTHIERGDYEDLEFNLSNDEFFTRIPDYGIQLNAVNNFPLRIPGYGENNGCYSSDLSLILADAEGNEKKYDISDCQNIKYTE